MHNNKTEIFPIPIYIIRTERAFVEQSGLTYQSRYIIFFLFMKSNHVKLKPL
jgi:hypothetical protein